VKFLEPDGLAGGWLVLDVEPSCLLARVFLGGPQVEIFGIWPHEATETAGLIG
jgi:hypothetical protein